MVRNRDAWESRAPAYESSGRRLWESAEPTWGIWNLDESVLGLLPDVAGLDTLELGCGSGHVSAWLARRLMLLRPRRRRRTGERGAAAQRSMYRFEWPDSDEVEFHLSHGDWIRVLRTNGLEVVSLLELCPSGAVLVVRGLQAPPVCEACRATVADREHVRTTDGR